MSAHVEFVTDRGTDGRAVLSVAGEVDLQSAPELRERLIALYHEGERVVVLDMSDVAFLDSTGLGVIVAALKRFRASGGDLVLRRPAERERKLLDLTGLSEIFQIQD